MPKNLEQKGPLIQNVVSFAKINLQELRLPVIAMKVAGSRYNRGRFPALVIRKNRPKSTTLIFQSGRMIIIGSESEWEAEVTAKKIAKDLSRILDKKITIIEFRITNLVANADLGYNLDISRISEDQVAQKDDCFPGAVHQMMRPVKTALLFSSGKVVFTGAKQFCHVEEALDKLHSTLKEYRVERKKN